jgi:hypothetical protein
MRHHGCNNETALVTTGIFFVFGAIVPSGPGQKLVLDYTQNSQQTDIHAPVRIEPTISAGARPQTYALDRADTGIGKILGITGQISANQKQLQFIGV